MTRTGKLLLGGLSAAAVLVGGAAGYFHVQRGSSRTAFEALTPSERNLAVFDAASALIEANYFDPEFLRTPAWRNYQAAWRAKAGEVQPALLYLNVLNNFASAFPDSHLGFEAPVVEQTAPRIEAPSPAKASAGIDVAKLLDIANSGPGYIAAQIRRDGIWSSTVAEVFAGSPAERAGIAPGWSVIRSGWSMDGAGVHFSADMLALDSDGARVAERTGLPPGVNSWNERDAYFSAHTTKVAFDLETLAARPDFEVRKLGDFTYLRFDSFEAGGPADKALDAIDAAGATGLIIDLRRNRGGRQLELIRVLGRLLGGGVLIGHIGDATAKSVPINAGNLGGDRYPGPLVVLIGPASASAAEIAAAAIQDHGRGRLIGRATSGSVVSGNRFTLPDGGRITIPVNDFVRIDQRRIEGRGVEPDIWLLQTLEDVRAGRDPVLDRAVEELRRPD
jgi:carboxyl-terminal processing protease